MAFLRRKPNSRFFIACFATADGTRAQRSTKQTDRRRALALAEQWEKAARLARERRLGEAQARRILSDIYEELAGAPLASSTARAFLAKWAEEKAAETAPGTAAIYRLIAREFAESLGTKADADLSQVTKADIANYRGAKLKKTSVSSANRALKVLRVAFGRAVKDGVLQTNPAAALDTLKRRPADEAGRRPFTVPEVRSILHAASPEWKGVILFGLYTGQRLGDIVRLTWRQVDAEQSTLSIITRKTGRRVNIPLAAPLLLHQPLRTPFPLPRGLSFRQKRCECAFKSIPRLAC